MLSAVHGESVVIGATELHEPVLTMNENDRLKQVRPTGVGRRGLVA